MGGPRLIAFRIGRLQKPPADLDARSSGLRRADLTGLGIVLDFGELIPVNDALAAARISPCRTAERPQHRKGRSSGHQREHKPQRHLNRVPGATAPNRHRSAGRVTS